MRQPTFPVILVVLLCGVAAGGELVCEGILGNSGEQGKSLVRFGDASRVRGMGVACDRFGSLWDRAGDGVLNRYAPDGRLLAQCRIPRGGGQRDQVTLVGDTLVLLIGDGLCTLPIAAPAGAEAKPLGRRADCISFGSLNGRLASAIKGEVSLVDPASGEATQIAAVAGTDAVEIGPDGAIYAMANGRVHKLIGGQPATDGWPKGAPGERFQFLDGYWFGHGWHGTIRRFNAALEPSPGVVLGGASGSFIGHLDQNSELSNGRGLAKLRENLYAVSGLGGILHLLQWNDEKQQMEIVRRIGAVPACRGLGLDRQGNVWWFAGSWRWDDRPDTPLRFGVNAAEFPGIGQAVMLDNDQMVAPGYLWGKPAIYRGSLTGEVRCDRIEKGLELKKGFVGSAVYEKERRLVLLVIDKAGKSQSFAVGSDGSFQAGLGPAQLRTAGETKEWTALAMGSPTLLLGAVDGQVVELRPDGADWKEAQRWSSWAAAPSEKLGARIHIAADSGRVWISDRERHRVLVFDGGKTRRPLAAFGQLDKPGDDLHSLAFPETLAARGNRAVVYDSGNQRLMKLSIQ